MPSVAAMDLDRRCSAWSTAQIRPRKSIASPTGSPHGVRPDPLDTSATVASTHGDECLQEPVDFRLIADVVRRRRCSPSSNSD